MFSRLLPRLRQQAKLVVPAFSPFGSQLTSSSSLINPTTTTHAYSSLPTKMTYETITLKDAVLARRSVYTLNKKAPVDDKRIQEIIQTAIKHVPSSFNSQSTRLVVLLKDEHDKFWSKLSDILKAHVSEAQWEHTNARLTGFKNAYGSVLFYEDTAVITGLQGKFATYADKFPQWSEHTSAMHQYFLWLALEAEGFGANLQHYNPLVDTFSSETWNVPANWSLKAQLVFGGREEGSEISEKTFQPVEERVFFHGA